MNWDGFSSVSLSARPEKLRVKPYCLSVKNRMETSPSGGVFLPMRWARASAAARERKREGGRSKASGNFPEAGNARDKIGEFAGVSGRTVDKIRDVVEACAQSKNSAAASSLAFGFLSPPWPKRAPALA